MRGNLSTASNDSLPLFRLRNEKIEPFLRVDRNAFENAKWRYVQNTSFRDSNFDAK